MVGGSVAVEAPVAAARGLLVPSLTLSQADGGQQVELVSGSAREFILDALVSGLPGIVLQRRMATDGTITYPSFSAGLSSTLGYAPEEMKVSASGALECIHWADRDGYLSRLHQSAATMTAYSDEFRCITIDGLVCWLSGAMRPRRAEDGSIVWDGVLLDITDRMRAEQQLSLIMGNAAVGMIMLTDTGMIDFANAATEKLFGYPPAELVGMSVWRLLADPTLLAGFSGESAGDKTREVVAQRQDGTTFDCEITLSETLSEGRRFFVGIVRDVTGNKLTEARLRETENRLSNIADNIQGIVFQWARTADGRDRYTFVSDGSFKVLGVDPEYFEKRGGNFFDFMTVAHQAVLNEAIVQSIRTMSVLEIDISLMPPLGREVWLRMVANPRRMPLGVVIWDGVAMDITSRKAAEDEIKFLAYNDPLTGLGNRRMFSEYFSRLQSHPDHDQQNWAVLCIGFDRFTVINASMGHSTGDRVLKAAAARLQESMGEFDILCRSGGDRFLMMTPLQADSPDVEELALSILARFEHPLNVEDRDFDLSLSVGVAQYPTHGDTAEQIIMHAEGALQRAKLQGAGSYQIFTTEMGQRTQSMLTMQQRLRRALDNEEFVAYFQPQVAAGTSKLVGCEALVRWNSPEHGMVMPGQFIDVAEEYGLIEHLCEQVLRDSCRWTKRWLDMKLPAVSVAVNISGRQFHNTRLLLSTVDQALEESGIPPEYLELELTESSAMTDPESAIKVVRLLAGRGINCSIDDFGTGYSSLSVLKRFPITKLKIDRSFVTDVTTDSNDAAIVGAIVAMAEALNLKVVAEGIETREHHNYLHALGCYSLQGYFFSRPLTGEAMEHLLIAGGTLPLPSPPRVS